jgi:predicted HD phosphohydrolase
VDVAPAASVDELLDLLAGCDGRFDSLGPDGDPIDILAHSLQCAAALREVAPDDVELQVAGLVHDLGHAVTPGEAAAHGATGAAYVRPLLGARVARLTELHVPAKRYLVAVDADYAAALSDGSTRSLAVQGGAVSDAERAELERHPHLPDALVLRRADEAAKIVGKVVPGLDSWRGAVVQVDAAG